MQVISESTIYCATIYYVMIYLLLLHYLVNCCTVNCTFTDILYLSLEGGCWCCPLICQTTPQGDYYQYVTCS